MSVSVPPDTDSWQEAVTEGYYGKRTDPFPDELYDAVRTGVPPTLTSMSPTSGPQEGGTQVTISGTRLYAPVITFGGQTATIDSLSGDGTSVVCITPPGSVGTVDVTITTPGGSHTESAGYMYEPPPEPESPRIDGTSPAELPLATVPPFVVTYYGYFEPGVALTAAIVSSDNQWTETTAVVESGAQRVATFSVAPLGATGIGYTVLKKASDGTMYTGQAAFTWT